MDIALKVYGDQSWVEAQHLWPRLRMRCIGFSMRMGSIVVFDVSAEIHAVPLAGMLIVVSVFETPRLKLSYFGGLGRVIGSPRW